MYGERQIGFSRSPLSRRRFLRTLALGSGTALLAACQSQAPAPAAPPASRPDSAAATGPSQPPAWESQWNELIEAARREGSVVVSGPPTPEVRTQLPAAFRSRFGVSMEYLGGRTGDLMARLKAERAAGQYTVDAMVSGATSLYLQGYPERMFDPLPPVLFHPEVTDPSRWIRGGLWFMDPEQQFILRLANQVSLHVVANTQYVNAAEIQTWSDLLDARYRGKISAYDPTVSGPGSNVGAYLLQTLGEDYVRALYQGQQAGLSRDERQLADWTARGTYPISLGVGANELEELRAQGFPIALVLRDRPETPPLVTAGFGLTVLVNGAPHPNAAKLFANWIAMKEGGEVYNRAQVSVSVRTDVDNAWAPEYIIPKPGVGYVDTYDWEWAAQGRNPEQFERLKRLTGR